jgi:lipooligosaccharide transport system permease protein
MTASTSRDGVAPPRPDLALAADLGWRGPARMIERNVRTYRRIWMSFAAGLFEPFVFLLSIGVGVGALVGDVEGPAGPVSYRAFVAPGLLASSAMFGAIMDSTITCFIRYKYIGVYRAVMATPMRPRDVAAGEVSTSLLRGGVYAAAFLLAMVAFGLVESPWAVLAVPVALLIGFAFAGAGVAASTFMRSWIDFDFVNMAVIPMFLFSGVFFPVAQYRGLTQTIVEWTPLYQGVELERALVLGGVEPGLLVNVLYLATMGFVCMRLGGRRLRDLLQP